MNQMLNKCLITVVSYLNSSGTQYYNELQFLILGLGSVLVFESSVLLRSPDLLCQPVSSGVAAMTDSPVTSTVSVLPFVTAFC